MTKVLIPRGLVIIIIIIFISSTSDKHTVFDKYISDTKKHTHNSYIHMYSTNNASNDVLPNRKILLDNINEFHFQTKTLTLLIVCKENPELYLYQIIQ